MSVFDNAKGLITKLTVAGVKDVGTMTVQQLRQDLATNYPPASSPGEPPHRRTGNLQNGVEASYSESGLKVEISSLRAGGDELIPLWLEFGTSKMAARPYMRPSKMDAPNTIRQSHNAVSRVE